LKNSIEIIYVKINKRKLWNEKHTRANMLHAEKTLPHFTIFFHPDYTVGFGIAPNHALRLVGCTTGRELHPALKIYSFYVISISVCLAVVKTFSNLSEVS
jgi:hypothetical protein